MQGSHDSDGLPQVIDRPEPAQALWWLPIVVLVVALSTLAIVHTGAFGSAAPAWYSVVWLTAGGAIIGALHLWAAASPGPNDALDSLTKMVSEYSDVPAFGSWMRAAFFCLAGSTLNTGILFAGLDARIEGSLIVAGFCAILMGFFSQRTLDKGMIRTSPTTGMIHSTAVTIAFSLAIFTMLLFAVDGKPDKLPYPDWLRAVALSECNVAVIATTIYAILSFLRVRFVAALRKQTGQGHDLPALLAADVKATSLKPRQTLGSSDPLLHMHSFAENRTIANERRVKLSVGSGLLERILIFMFLQWELILAIVDMKFRHP